MQNSVYFMDDVYAKVGEAFLYAPNKIYEYIAECLGRGYSYRDIESGVEKSNAQVCFATVEHIKNIGWKVTKFTLYGSICAIFATPNALMNFLGPLVTNMSDLKGIKDMWEMLKKAKGLNIAEGVNAASTSLLSNTAVNFVYIGEAFYAMFHGVVGALGWLLETISKITVDTLCCGTITLERSRRFDINKLDCVTTILSLVYSFNTSLAFATLGKEAGSFLGPGLSYLPFSFNLLCMWATRYSGIKGLFLNAKNLLGKNLNLAVAGDLISYRSNFKVPVASSENLFAPLNSPQNDYGTIGDDLVFNEPDNIQNEQENNQDKLQARQHKNVENALGEFLTEFYLQREKKEKGQEMENFEERNIYGPLYKTCFWLGAPVAFLLAASLYPVLVPKAIQGYETLLKNNFGKNSNYQSVGHLVLGYLSVLPTPAFYYRAIQKLPIEMLNTAASTADITKNKGITPCKKVLAISGIITASALIAYCSIFSGRGMMSVARSAISKGWLSYLGISEQAEGWFFGALSKALPYFAASTVTAINWSSQQTVLNDLIRRVQFSKHNFELSKITEIDIDIAMNLLKKYPKLNIERILDLDYFKHKLSWYHLERHTTTRGRHGKYSQGN